MSTDLGRREFTLRQRRAMGLTIPNLARVTRALISEGVINKDSTPEEVEDAVITRLAMDNPKAFADPSIDWEGFAAFIAQIMPFILQILALFGLGL